MHQHLHAGQREKRADPGYILEMVKTYLYVFDVWNKTELTVKTCPGFLTDCDRLKPWDFGKSCSPSGTYN